MEVRLHRLLESLPNDFITYTTCYSYSREQSVCADSKWDFMNATILLNHFAHLTHQYPIRSKEVGHSSFSGWVWGSGPCLALGSAEATMLRPRPIEELAGLRIVDISAGDSHALALTHESEVYAWGSNTMGQCGQGHTLSPITRPKKVMGLDAAVHQISAGTTHSIAWTAIPTDRRVVSWHRPFCVDLQEGTFSLLRTFIEQYCIFDDPEQPVTPFASLR
ncbi:probable E3 ubiquitin-protein ligase HERC1 [Macrobrachium nipponense]|uniref:probable E3 ubiquitin-protein ligase HERC1 n=1 Tax=Macrobrachium nipponense TaxID=159736 RepID=UPI0030C85354